MTDIALQRENMVESQIRTADVTDRRLLKAFQDLPREVFVPASKRTLAYMGENIVVRPADTDGPARELLAPMALARLVQLAEIQETDVVLDVGCGTGYGSCLIAHLAESVVGTEIVADLTDLATKHAGELAIDNVAFVTSPLNEGYPADAPYDVIVLNGAVPEVPKALFEQLSEGGRLVAFLSEGEFARAVRYKKTGNSLARTETFDCGVPALPGFARKKSFVF